ncbi:glycosyltransferase family 8 protein [Helicobacter kayseriensis]|uniref:glycosyltransferase family 8 protein n=1 Tax=Helicobacter kayseriensis TaxID=2905877 RepID=UPI001E363ADE|nr:hypothetical protein [Helicobacter kayseriensis]MCE3048597.1 hypothetical protein [Helicobacter kayseriensis]
MIHNNISPNDQEKLQLTIKPFSHFATLDFIHAQNYLQDVWKKLTHQYHFSYEVFYKLIAPSLFPQYDKIIISDVDVVFLGDITRSFDDFDCNEDYLIGGVVSNDPQAFFPLPSKGWRSGYKKFDSKELEAISHGVDGCYLIINLKGWRKENIQEKAIRYLENNAHKLVLAEQDVLNIVCFPHNTKISLAHVVSHTSWKNFGELWEKFKPNIYSQQEITEARLHPIQLHFVGANKPWNTPSEPKSDLWFSYLCKTPFLQDYLCSLESLMFAKFQKSRFFYRALNYIKRKFFK